MRAGTGNRALVSAVLRACSVFGRSQPEVVVAVIPIEGGYKLRMASFPKIVVSGECYASYGEVAAAFSYLVGTKDSLAFLYGQDPERNGFRESWWALFNPILEIEDTVVDKVRFVPLITD